ncbi:MAG: segregation and condensation protein A [Terracidiphilus sp.]
MTDPSSQSEDAAAAEIVIVSAQEPVEIVEAALEVEPEVAEIAEAEAVIEFVPEPVEAVEAVVEAEPEMANIITVEAVSESAPEAVEVVEAVADAGPDDAEKTEEKAEVKAEEQVDEKSAEMAAAKLAARQKKLDEGSEQSPFSVFVGQVYDGPLDLLLDLIRKQDIDIYDIPIGRITAQFLAYVNQLKASDVDVAGEFIYTASLLIHIKSKMLLPRAPTGPEEVAEDPRRELVERLLEHERFKNAAQMLQQKQMLEAASWSNPGIREFKEEEAVEPEIAADTVDLVRVFREILERARTRPILDVEEDSVTVDQMIQFLARRLNMEDKPVALRRLLSHTRSERALIAIFLALLEMVRIQAILLRQDRAFSEIFVKKHTGFDAVMNEGLMNARDDWR